MARPQGNWSARGNARGRVPGGPPGRRAPPPRERGAAGTWRAPAGSARPPQPPPRNSARSLAEAGPARSPPSAANYPPCWLQARRRARQRRGRRAGERRGSPGRPHQRSRGGRAEIRAAGTRRAPNGNEPRARGRRAGLGAGPRPAPVLSFEPGLRLLHTSPRWEPGLPWAPRLTHQHTPVHPLRSSLRCICKVLERGVPRAWGLLLSSSLHMLEGCARQANSALP